jgi:hypothetical protein
MSRYTRLESAVMAALAHDLRGQVPDLAGQFEESRPSQRRNSGFGLFTEMIVDRARPAPASGPTGDLGTVHAMVGSLPDPIAFKARVRHGVLLGLFGDSYGQDTRAIDFATVPFRQVFTVDAHGRSIAFEPVELMPPSPLRDLQKHDDARPPAPPPPLRNEGALQRIQDPEPPRKATGLLADPRIDQALDRAARQMLGPPPAGAAAMSKEEKTSWRVFLWTGLFALGAILILVFKVSTTLVFIIGMVLGRFLQTDSGLSALKRGADEIKKAQARSS